MNTKPERTRQSLEKSEAFSSVLDALLFIFVGICIGLLIWATMG